MPDTTLPRPLVAFGLAGLLPQAICLLLVLHGGSERWIGLAAACFYAALILSFLGGLWWMAGLLSGRRAGWVYGLAIVPSLIGLAALLPWNAGWNWPGPSLVVLALALLESADRSRPRPAHCLPRGLAAAAGHYDQRAWFADPADRRCIDAVPRLAYDPA